MKNFQLALILLSACSLSACTNTMAGAGKDASGAGAWFNNRPAPNCVNPPCSTIDGVKADLTGSKPAAAPVQTAAAPAPAKIADTSQPVNIKPEADAASAPATPDAADAIMQHSWNSISVYDAAHPTLPGAPQSAVITPPVPPADQPPQIVKYNHSVDVYPVNGDMDPYAKQGIIGEGPAPTETRVETPPVESVPFASHSISQQLVQQVFFAHGSSKVGRLDRKNLAQVAQSLRHNTAGYKVNVVGHASKRVNGVTDPLQKKMINFKIAQDRATAVSTALKKAGAAPEWVIATSEGDDQPNPHPNGKSQEAADRRAEVFVGSTDIPVASR